MLLQYCSLHARLFSQKNRVWKDLVVLENNNKHLKQRSAEGLPLFRALLSSRQEVVLVSCLWVGPGVPGSAAVQSVRSSAW